MELELGWAKMSLQALLGKATELVIATDADRESEDEDARIIQTFIAVGCSDAPDRVLEALLPSFLRHTAQPKLANAAICLTFDAEGRLHAIR
ncbi:hypothetical protein AMP9_3967 [plant metagenome]|uniref:Uncharacterized protein n=2 Tax=plant metagenome TaxID=1297885 RepID=A0A484P8E7_9ZZZZ